VQSASVVHVVRHINVLSSLTSVQGLPQVRPGMSSPGHTVSGVPELLLDELVDELVDVELLLDELVDDVELLLGPEPPMPPTPFDVELELAAAPPAPPDVELELAAASPVPLDVELELAAASPVPLEVALELEAPAVPSALFEPHAAMLATSETPHT
jgi:hypothetical protein